MDLPDPGIGLTSLVSPHWRAGSLPLMPPGKPSNRADKPIKTECRLMVDGIESGERWVKLLNEEVVFFLGGSGGNVLQLGRGSDQTTP